MEELCADWKEKTRCARTERDKTEGIGLASGSRRFAQSMTGDMIRYMSKAVLFVTLTLFLTPLMSAEVRDTGGCPVLLVSATADSDAIAVTFRDMTKMPIRRLEFSCKWPDARADKAHPTRCYEPNGSFMPRDEYTLRYSYQRGVGRRMLVSVKSVTFSDGHIWMPSRRESCRVLTVRLPRAK